jgi:peroxiredoxin
MTIAVGQKIPSGSLRHMTADGPKEVTTDDLFKGKKVVVFGLPGAFTPTCSAKHLPGYVEKTPDLSAKGVDQVVCVSVNDAFVMDAWGKSQNVGDKVMMAADGNGDFVKSLGLENDFSKNGMGLRSKRFSMLVEDGVVKQLNIEPPGGFDISSAEHMLSHV